ncbi:hypothetical protein CDAR_10141 [Caerostris darwini]|uniref:Uncharacterized protein n=1 Tax=Caerostris darwini TaxID=1538125 RepID=A0AAV4RFW1_9ARAC|nr:hypothetical protein CDAR_10141 [Caerostris darwini]
MQPRKILSIVYGGRSGNKNERSSEAELSSSKIWSSPLRQQNISAGASLALLMGLRSLYLTGSFKICEETFVIFFLIEQSLQTYCSTKEYELK